MSKDLRFQQALLKFNRHARACGTVGYSEDHDNHDDDGCRVSWNGKGVTTVVLAAIRCMSALAPSIASCWRVHDTLQLHKSRHYGQP